MFLSVSFLNRAGSAESFALGPILSLSRSSQGTKLPLRVHFRISTKPTLDEVRAPKHSTFGKMGTPLARVGSVARTDGSSIWHLTGFSHEGMRDPLKTAEHLVQIGSKKAQEDDQDWRKKNPVDLDGPQGGADLALAMLDGVAPNETERRKARKSTAVPCLTCLEHHGNQGILMPAVVQKWTPSTSVSSQMSLPIAIGARHVLTRSAIQPSPRAQDQKIINTRTNQLALLGEDLSKAKADIVNSYRVQATVVCQADNRISTAVNPCMACQGCCANLNAFAGDSGKSLEQMLSCTKCKGIGQRVGFVEMVGGVHPAGRRRIVYVCGNPGCDGVNEPLAECVCP